MAKNVPDPRQAASNAAFGTGSMLKIMESANFKALAKELPAFMQAGNDTLVATLGDQRRNLTKEEQAAIVGSKLTTAIRNAALGKWD